LRTIKTGDRTKVTKLGWGNPPLFNKAMKEENYIVCKECLYPFHYSLVDEDEEMCFECLEGYEIKEVPRDEHGISDEDYQDIVNLLLKYRNEDEIS